MNNDGENSESDTLPLVGARRLLLRRNGESDALTLVDSDGTVAVTVVITRDAITLRLGGADLELEVERSLSITAQSIALHGRDSVTIGTEGKLATTGRSQAITATHGNVQVEANDDVKLNGERVLFNC